MRKCIRTACLTVVLMLAMVATALANYPGTLDSGNLVLVDGGMGVGYYAVGGPYTKGESFTLKFRYNWDRKVISYQRGKTWLDWDVNRDYSHQHEIL